MNNCINSLYLLSEKINSVESLNNSDEIINILQEINNELSSIFKLFGTESFEDLLLVCFGSNNINLAIEDKCKFDILKKYFHPTSYKLLSKNEEDSILNEKSKNLDMTNVDVKIKSFYLKSIF